MKFELAKAWRSGSLLAGLALTCGAGHALSAPATAGASGAVRAAPSRLVTLSLSFEENIGQAGSADVQYLAHGRSFGIALTRQGAVLALGSGKKPDGTADGKTVRIQLEGARADLAPHAEQPLPGRVNYLIGSDPARWRTDVATYGQVRYAGVYPGVDLVYYGNQGHLEYDFVVAPGARSAPIGVRFDGATKLALDAQGNLRIDVGGRQIAFERPVAYQMDGDVRKPVRASYRLAGDTVRFRLGNYDHDKPLVIDPVLSYLSYLGGSDQDEIGTHYGWGPIALTQWTQAAAVDSAGNLYVAGATLSNNFPTQGGVPATAKSTVNTPNSQPWVFVSKIAPDAKTLVYSTYFGGSFADVGMAIAVDAQGGAYVTGNTNSADFPVTAGAFQTLCGPANGAGYQDGTSCNVPANSQGGSSAFVVKLNPAGNAIAYSTFLGTAGSTGLGIAVDGSGNAYVAGSSPATNCIQNGSYTCFPTTANAVLRDTRGPGDATEAFLTVLNPTGTALVYSTLFGEKTLGTSPPTPGAYATIGTAVVIDAQGNFYLGGMTQSSNLPTTPGSLEPAASPVVSSGFDELAYTRGFVAKFSPVNVTAPVTEIYGTYIGGVNGQSYDSLSGLAVDAAGDAYVYGQADPSFPVSAGAYQTGCALPGETGCGQGSAYVAKLNPSGSALLGATFFAATGHTVGLQNDQIYTFGPMTVDAAGNAYITGEVQNGLVQVNPIQPTITNPCCSAAFVAEFDPTLSKLLFSTLLGNNAVGDTSVAGVAVDAAGSIYLAGNTGAAGTLATTPGVFQPSYGGTNICCSAEYGDGFVAKIANPLVVATSTALTVSPTSATSGTAITFSATVTPASGSGVPTGTVAFDNGATTLGTATLNSAGHATFTSSTLANGTYSVTAVYGGDATDATSSSSAESLTIAAAPAPDFALALSAAGSTVSPGATATVQVAITPANGFVGATTLSCSGLPANATCSFSPASVTPSGSAASSSTLTIGTGTTTAASASAAPTMAALGGLSALLTGVPGLLLLPVLARRSRRQRQLCGLAVLLLAGFALAGCGGGGGGGGGSSSGGGTQTTPAGTYTITVTGTSGSLTHSATYKLVVS